jgi:hypothetical protein
MQPAHHARHGHARANVRARAACGGSGGGAYIAIYAPYTAIRTCPGNCSVVASTGRSTWTVVYGACQIRGAWWSYGPYSNDWWTYIYDAYAGQWGFVTDTRIALPTIGGPGTRDTQPANVCNFE